MKKIIGSILFAVAAILIIGIFGVYESAKCTTMQFVIYEAIAFAVCYIGYKMIDIKEG